MTIQEMRDEIQKLEQELKLMGEICAYEYQILEEKQKVA